MKLFLSIVGVTVLLLVGGIMWSNTLQKSDPDIVSRTGLHWHPNIEITVGTEKIEISSNIGIGPQYSGMPTAGLGMMGMTAIHTHSADGIIHLEFSGLVRKENIALGNFFRIWGKDMRSFGDTMRMTVNGTPNTEYERYIMRDKDIIELHYDSP